MATTGRKRKTTSSHITVASDSDSETNNAPLRICKETHLHRAFRTGTDGFTHVHTTRLEVPASPTKRWAPERDLLAADETISTTVDNFEPVDSPFLFAGEDSFVFDEGHPLEPLPWKQRDSDFPMCQWWQRRQCFLDELIRLEGRGPYCHQTKCAGDCSADLASVIHRCKDCFTDALFCQPCLVECHRDNPLHRVEIWTDGCFERTTLKSLGLRIQLGHGRNGMCTAIMARRAEAAQAGVYKPAVTMEKDDDGQLLDDEDGHEDDGAIGWKQNRRRDDFCIVASNGIHEVGLDFCACELAEPHDIQLLRARLYPVTTTNPATAATFDVLRQFHMLSLEAKCSAHHFYNQLARTTNNNGVFQPRMTRQWCHLQMFKRTGRGHATDGIAGTKAGECVLLCPACPQPGKNLPLDGSWRSAPKDKSFLYALFLALDANFRMKRKDVSSEAGDPLLGRRYRVLCEEQEVGVPVHGVELPDPSHAEKYASTAVAGDEADDVRGDLHAHEMIDMGLQLEEQQRALAADTGALKTHATDRQKTAILERSNKLGRKITEWLKIRESFTPLVATLRVQDDHARAQASRLQPAPPLPVHVVKLWLPSKLATTPNVTVKGSHARLEFELRQGQAHMALEEFRRLLLVRTAKYIDKDQSARGVVANTRAKTTIANIDERIRRTATQYHVAHQAVANLAPLLGETAWKDVLQILTADDGDPDAGGGGGGAAEEESRRTTGFLDLVVAVVNEGIEWAKTRARAYRWTEEVDLVEEEMHRVLEFLRWKARWWIDLIDHRRSFGNDFVLQEGFVAYARRQSKLQLGLRERFLRNWKGVPRYIQMGQDSLGNIPAEEGDEGVEGDEGEGGRRRGRGARGYTRYADHRLLRGRILGLSAFSVRWAPSPPRLVAVRLNVHIARCPASPCRFILSAQNNPWHVGCARARSDAPDVLPPITPTT
ncbi:hypothetical protein MSAN_00867900 [Mycena sanguinolenta]|uniref:CxC2-like cysteine cluster KDZ transposase-associated domain-containing protein n=1 Tax=Mycena sanguinolenta TaxID=230812 RepID=A0A8H7DDY6_9AGAR|nr:hypothetical protein MSAN_00867900 [Mycena sanguinolenta]